MRPPSERSLAGLGEGDGLCGAGLGAAVVAPEVERLDVVGLGEELDLAAA
jgi:hypothetical protein